MGIDGIGRGGRPAQTTETRAPQAPVSPRPAAAESTNKASQPGPVGDFFKDAFEKVKDGIEGIFGGGGGGAGGVGGGVGEVVQKVVQAAKDAQKLKDVKDILADSPTGAAAVKYLEDKKIPVEFADGGGSYWDGNKIVIDRSQDPQEAALTLVHEVNHAKASIDGPKADIVNDTRGDYVQKMLDEEVRGTVDSIKAKNELVANGKNVTASFPLEKEYNDAYKQAVKDAKKKDPDLTDEQLRAIGEKAGYDAVLDGFKTGKVVTSTNGQTYPEYYGSAWDSAHP
ncbi:hypothetical protein HPC49_07510 [Pyxidicoccus fallax]|uniref:Uncharacterized protein n=1 Tax=Pyxidicoccus fallax TaxID=394095 RepID=A0A848L9L6_9BACT|nr:DUF6782 family putative metallopeptidase [Pyxidicoccus fallax]NMO15539.1 hypothetical protein [Pyxidicoccus fallax]NPC78099.1 hypothetical protein [Pyxidicoccus fallax]